MRKCIAFDFILLYQRTFYLILFPINYFLIAFHSSWVCIHWNEMYKTKCNRCASVFIHRKWNIQNEVPSGAFFSVHSPEMKYTKRSTIPFGNQLLLKRPMCLNKVDLSCIFQCSFTGNEIYKTRYHRLHFSVFIHRKWNEMYKIKLPLFASKEKHVGKKLFIPTQGLWSVKKTFPIYLMDKTFFSG